MFALISLHIFLYGCNILAWRGCRINHNFIFEFSPNTALKHRDAFLVSASLMTAVVAALVVHLLLRSAGVLSQQHVDIIPGALLLVYINTYIYIYILCDYSNSFTFIHYQSIKHVQVFTVFLFLPFNVFYRSTRYCFLRVIRNIIFSPLYKVIID